jgi:hypothetical protein
MSTQVLHLESLRSPTRSLGTVELIGLATGTFAARTAGDRYAIFETPSDVALACGDLVEWHGGDYVVLHGHRQPSRCVAFVYCKDEALKRVA